jgi:hypothetical protein
MYLWEGEVSLFMRFGFTDRPTSLGVFPFCRLSSCHLSFFSINTKPIINPMAMPKRNQANSMFISQLIILNLTQSSFPSWSNLSPLYDVIMLIVKQFALPRTSHPWRCWLFLSACPSSAGLYLT